jgi:hypothetical protein
VELDNTYITTALSLASATLSSADAWTVWIGNTCATTTTATWDPWPAWVLANRLPNVYTNVTASATMTWPYWVQEHQRLNGLARVIRPRPRQKTDAEVQAELLAQKRYEEELSAKRLAKRQADRRAEQLLRGCLSPEQQRDLEEKGCFYVETPGGRRYRIDRGTHGNVKRLDERGSILAGYCAQPAGIPVADSMLAQKLALEADEDGFLRVANARPN